MDDQTVEEAERPAFRPAVGRAKSRVRPSLLIALACTLTAGAVVLVTPILRRETLDEPAQEHVAQAGQWATQCTALGVATAIRNPGWSELERTTCLAIAGRIDDARTRLQAMADGTRRATLQRIFQIAHPIADAGDDRSAGPIMGLVVEFWPENYMAVFHAGMASFALGDDRHARELLDQFLVIYKTSDVWRARAIKAVADIEAHTPTSQREAHFPE